MTATDERSGSGEQPRWPSSRTGCRHPAGSSFRGINGSYGTEPSQKQILSLITPCAQALACVAHQITRVCARSTLPLIAAAANFSSQAACCADRAPAACPVLRMHAFPYGPPHPAGRPSPPSIPGSLYDVLVLSPVHSINQAAGPGSVQTLVIDLSHFDDGLLGISLRRGPARQTLDMLHAWHESRIQVIDSIDGSIHRL